MPTPAPDPALRHDVSAVLALPGDRAAGLVVPLARDVLDGAYGDASRARLATLLVGRPRRPWRRPDVGAASDRLEAAEPHHLAAALRELAGLPRG